jgi:hypothetical protein
VTGAVVRTVWLGTEAKLRASGPPLQTSYGDTRKQIAPQAFKRTKLRRLLKPIPASEPERGEQGSTEYRGSQGSVHQRRSSSGLVASRGYSKRGPRRGREYKECRT